MELNNLEGKWEEVPDEDLWEDGELNSTDVAKKIYWAVVQQGEWKLIREVNYDQDSNLEWAHTITLEKDKWDAITKANIRIQNENKKCESKG